MPRHSIMYVVESLDPGGTERLAIDMALAFAEEYRVIVVCLDRPGQWVDRLRREGVPVYCVRRAPGLDLRTAWRIARLSREHNIELIHAHQCSPWFYSALSRLFHRRPRVLLHEHGRFYPEIFKPARVRVNRLLIRRLSHGFVAVSQDIAHRLAAYEGLDEDQIEVVYNGVSAPRQLTLDERLEMRRSIGIEDASILAGTVGRFDAIKNLPLLLQAFADAHKLVPNLRLLLVGDGEEMSRVRALAAELQVGRQVIFTGYREDAAQLAQCMDLFVLPSFSEGISVSLLEAMGGGVAPIVTDVGGNPEVVEHGTCGWVVPSDHRAALAATLEDAATGTEVRERLACAAARRVDSMFGIDRFLAEFRARYEALLTS